MAIAIANTKNALAAFYTLGTTGTFSYTGATFIGLAATNPGTAATPSTEITGGSPAYARVATTWGVASLGIATGTAVTINIPTTTTVTYALLASAATVATTNMVDNCTVTSTTYNAQGSAIITPTFTVT